MVAMVGDVVGLCCAGGSGGDALFSFLQSVKFILVFLSLFFFK